MGFIAVITGINGSGKTTTAAEIAAAYKKATRRPVLWFTPSGSPAPEVANEVHRPDSPTPKAVTAKLTQLNDRKNCLIVVDDASAYFRGVVPPPILSLLVDRRHRAVSAVFVLHSLDQLPPYLVSYVSFFVLHRGQFREKVVTAKYSPDIARKLIAAQNAINRNANFHNKKRIDATL